MENMCMCICVFLEGDKCVRARVCLQDSERMCVFWIKSFTPGPQN